MHTLRLVDQYAYILAQNATLLSRSLFAALVRGTFLLFFVGEPSHKQVNVAMEKVKVKSDLASPFRPFFWSASMKLSAYALVSWQFSWALVFLKLVSS